MADAMPEPDDAAAVSPSPVALPGPGLRSDDQEPAPAETVTATAEAGGASKATATLALVAVAGLLVSLTQSLLVPVLPQLAIDLHASATATEWLLTSTLLVGAVAVPVFGRLGDLYGKRLMLVVTLVTFVAGSLICAFTSDIGVMIAGRAVVGLSVAAIPVGISLVGTVLPPKRAGNGIALISATLGIGGALGLPLAGLIAQHADYHVLFWICVGGGVIALVGTLAVVPEPPVAGHGRFDLPGTALLAVALTALLLPLSEASVWGWGDPRTVGLLAAAVVLLVAFVLIERRLASPVVDMTVNARPALLLTNIASLCVGFALFATLIGTSNFVETPAAAGYGFGADILVGGLCLLPSGLCMLALSPVSARISARFGPKIALGLGAAIVGAGFILRIFLVAHLWEVIVGTSIAGAGTGIAYAAMPSLILRSAPRGELAAANGLNSLARAVGSSLASAVGGTILTSQVIMLGGLALPSLSAYRTLFAICAAAAIAGAVIALVIPGSPPVSAAAAADTGGVRTEGAH